MSGGSVRPGDAIETLAICIASIVNHNVVFFASEAKLKAVMRVVVVREKPLFSDSIVRFHKSAFKVNALSKGRNDRATREDMILVFIRDFPGFSGTFREGTNRWR